MPAGCRHHVRHACPCVHCDDRALATATATVTVTAWWGEGGEEALLLLLLLLLGGWQHVGEPRTQLCDRPAVTAAHHIHTVKGGQFSWYRKQSFYSFFFILFWDESVSDWRGFLPSAAG